MRLDCSRRTCELIVLHVPKPPGTSLARSRKSRRQTQLGAELAKFNTNSDLTSSTLECLQGHRTAKKQTKTVLLFLIHMWMLANTAFLREGGS